MSMTPVSGGMGACEARPSNVSRTSPKVFESEWGPLTSQDVRDLGTATGRPFHWPPREGELLPIAAYSLAGIRASERKAGQALGSTDIVGNMLSVNRWQGEEVFSKEMIDLIGRRRG